MYAGITQEMVYFTLKNVRDDNSELRYELVLSPEHYCLSIYPLLVLVYSLDLNIMHFIGRLVHGFNLTGFLLKA